MDSITARIEKDLVTSRIKRLKKLPNVIYKQLSRIEIAVFKAYKLDSVYTGSIMLDSLDACANSKLTLDQLEDIVKNESGNYGSFEILLRKSVKAANKRKVKLTSELITRIFGKTTRNTVKV
jgi:hypothetical protein